MGKLVWRPDPAERYEEDDAEPECAIFGVTAGETPDEEEVYQRACKIGDRSRALYKRRRNQYLRFSHGPAALVFFGDLHFGGNGVNYRKAFADAELARDTPGMFVALAGADLDNFVIEKLIHYNMDGQLTIDDQWALFRRWLKIIALKLRLVVSGNHDAWTWLLTRVDYMRETVAGISERCLYDRDDCRVTVQIGDRLWPGRVRHRWRGKSIYNPTHGMERMMKWDGGEFVWAAGAHDHDGGCCRSLNLGGVPRLCVKTWTYKFSDVYERRQGYPQGGPHESVTIIFDAETGEMTGVESLEMAAKIMARFY